MRRVLPLSILVACERDEAPVCDTAPEAIGLYDETELPFLAADVVDWLEGPEATALSWSADDSTTSLTLYAAHETQGARLVHVDDGACTPLYEVDIVLDFATADARFAEIWEIVVTTDDPARARFDQTVTLTELEGDYEITEIADPGTYDRFDLAVHAELAPDGGSGSILGSGYRGDETTPFEVADRSTSRRSRTTRPADVSIVGRPHDPGG
jgi:hypothetical protein